MSKTLPVTGSVVNSNAKKKKIKKGWSSMYKKFTALKHAKTNKIKPFVKISPNLVAESVVESNIYDEAMDYDDDDYVKKTD